MLLDAAVHAPTAMHQEPWKFVVIQDRALLRRLSDRAKALAIAQACGARQSAQAARRRRGRHTSPFGGSRLQHLL